MFRPTRYFRAISCGVIAAIVMASTNACGADSNDESNANEPVVDCPSDSRPNLDEPLYLWFAHKIQDPDVGESELAAAADCLPDLNRDTFTSIVPLSIAVSEGNIVAVRVLIRLGASVNYQFGARTALTDLAHIPAENFPVVGEQIVAEFAAAKIDPCITVDGSSPVEVLRRKGREDVIRALQEAGLNC